MRKHTPGPLKTETRTDGDVEITDSGGAVLATVYGDDNDPQCWPVTANSLLFATAPNLLAACKTALSYLEEIGSSVGPGESTERVRLACTRLRLQAVITKAEGCER
jgi:hypothetical protein